MRQGTGSGSLTGLLFVLPAILLLVILLYGPAAMSIFNSLHTLKGVTPDRFVGLDNYARLLANPTLPSVVWTTTVFVILATVLTVALATLIALAADSLPATPARIAQIGIILPWAISAVVGALLFRWFYISDLGLFRHALAALGFGNVDPLMNPTTAMAALVASAAWKKLGFAVILILAGLKAIPRDLYEAAHVDGASGFQVFRLVTLPMLAGPLLICTVVLAIADLNSVELPLVVTGGGPLGSTTTVALAIYSMAFSQYDIQGALTLAVLTFLINIVLVAVYVRIVRRRRA